MMVNARLALPLSLFDSNAFCTSGPGGSEEMTESTTQLSKTSSSVGSLEDISSPDDVQVWLKLYWFWFFVKTYLTTNAKETDINGNVVLEKNP